MPATRSTEPAESTGPEATGAVALEQAPPAPSRRPRPAAEPEPETQSLDTTAIDGHGAEDGGYTPSRAAGEGDPEDGKKPGRFARLRTRPVVLLSAALAVLIGLSVFFGIENERLRGAPSAQNAALVDVGTTSQVIDQISDALKKVYSYDFTRLDENEKAARAVITPAFSDQFDKLFAQVRQLAPQQQAVVTATISNAAVRELDGDHAVLVVFMDQQATRAADNQQLAAAGRLTVTAQRVDGQWKIADVQSR
ncbi:DUF4440 domain-containing protein [Pseudonocardia acidicola]|uniref:Nuclear transport factor 2 family protein n=1 Tax=Pseudonocardia acidicola TaxID=2724939 RepID=A0ABX1SHT5_9PSEU|nr:nuclear transport factor 2 family protein [Pseudonocardia acidicola]